MNGKQWYLEFLKTPRWKAQREGAFLRWGRFCGCCGDAGPLEIHHLNYKDLESCEAEDLMPLCTKHHEIAHTIPMLNSMVRATGNHWEKRRLVIEWIHRTAARPGFAMKVESIPKQSPGTTSRLATPAHREELEKIFRYRKGSSVLWPDNAVLAVLERRAVPLSCRPPGYSETSRGNRTPIVLTRKIMNELKTPRGGYTNATLEALGVPRGNKGKGWMQKLRGSTVTGEVFQRARRGSMIRHIIADLVEF